ncbi:hypothetical protein ACIPPS_11620 [Streptomyces sp. NPDC090127]|uniref:hypothetical protein n=1 Tax=Streptomyces sp. NPDC090127 TaxID=3365953 RepID=UPI00380D7F4B
MLQLTRGRLVAVAATTAALVFAAQGTATAAPQRAVTEGGYAEWNADPYNGIPGDAIRACDTTADGWGIEAWLDIDRNGTVDRIASTRGKDAPYCTGWVSGNIEPEGRPIQMWAVTVKGSSTKEKGGLIWSHS